MSFGKRRTLPLEESLGPILWDQAVTLPLDIGLWMVRLDLSPATPTGAMEQAIVLGAVRRAAEKFANRLTLARLLAATLTRPITTPLPEATIMARLRAVLTAMEPTMDPVDRRAYTIMIMDVAASIARLATPAPTPVVGWWRFMTKPVGQGTPLTTPSVAPARIDGLRRLATTPGVDDWTVAPIGPSQQQNVS
jgi:hypothetical protein